MDVGLAPAAQSPPTRSAPQVLELASDSQLVALARQGRPAAFEAIYERYRRPLLSFCRLLLGDREDAQDALQHTFMSAYGHLDGSGAEITLRPWLFAIARNRCYTILRARREQPADAEETIEAEAEEVSVHVQRREDLRELIVDLQRLPRDQRAALVLAELEAMSHAEIATVLGVRPAKVKALVFQGRESLLAARKARQADCASIREQLVTLRGRGLRRGHLRRHLRDCVGCRAFREQLDRESR